MFEQFGQTPEEIAVSLRRLGITGARNTVRKLNPVVRYVQIVRGDGLPVDMLKGDVLRIRHPDGLAA